MITKFSSDTPIYMQIAEAIEDDILNGIYAEETQVPSTNEISALLKINPATAGKGVNLLVDEKILYKRRGVGMFVSIGAVEVIRRKRKDDFYEAYVVKLLVEAAKLSITHKEIIAMISKSGENVRSEE